MHCYTSIMPKKMPVGHASHLNEALLFLQLAACLLPFQQVLGMLPLVTLLVSCNLGPQLLLVALS